MIDLRKLDETVSGARGAHVRLLATVEAMTGGDERELSLLPGWTRGHVLTHLARNADSHTGLFAAAARGEIGDQYPGGVEQRNDDIERGAGRPIGELVDDLRRSIRGLEQAWAAATAPAWEGRARSPFGGEMNVRDLPFRRWREVEVHHADLGLGAFTYDDWSPGYVRRELDRETRTWASRRPMGMTSLPQAAQALTPARRVAWLLGRYATEELPGVIWA